MTQTSAIRRCGSTRRGGSWVTPRRSATSTTSRSTSSCSRRSSASTGSGTNEHHQNAYGFMCNPNLFGAILARLTRDLGYDDVAIVQLGATIAATPPIRIAEEYAILDCISGGRLVAGLPLGLGVRRRRLLQRHADRAARALARGDRPPHQGVDGEGVLRLERQALPVPQGQPVAAADPGAAPAAHHPRRGVVVDVGLLPRPRHPVRLPQLLRRQVLTGGDGPLLGAGGGERPRPQPVPRRVPPARRRRRHRRAGRGAVRRARRVLLQEAACTARRSTSRRPATATTRACSTSSSRGSSSSPTSASTSSRCRRRT